MCTIRAPGYSWRHASGRAIVIPGVGRIAAAALLARLVLLAGVALYVSQPVNDVVSWHDGAEYMAYAEELARLDLRAVPESARRHDIGLPLLMSVPCMIMPSWLAGMCVGWGSLVLLLHCMAGLLRRHTGLPLPRVWLVCWAIALAYPSLVYYNLFVLTENAYLLAVVCALSCYLGGRFGWAYLLAGLASLVRGPGILMGIAFCLNDLASGRWRRAAGIAPAAGIYVAAMMAQRLAWGGGAIDIHAPAFGLPFCGWAGFGGAPLARIVYVLACFALCAAGVALLCAEGWRDACPLRRVAALYCLLFLAFHLCLESVNYLGTTVRTFPYFDRYLVGVLPFVCVGLEKLLFRRVLCAAFALSVVLSAYWAANHARARSVSAAAPVVLPRLGAGCGVNISPRQTFMLTGGARA